MHGSHSERYRFSEFTCPRSRINLPECDDALSDQLRVEDDPESRRSLNMFLLRFPENMTRAIFGKLPLEKTERTSFGRICFSFD